MEMSSFGNTDLKVSRLGTGLAEMGYELTLDDVTEAGRVLNAALDGGINFLDTAASYQVSEELIGRTIAHRRDEYILATKCGGVHDGYEGVPWTAQTIRDSVDRSLTRMKTDHLDLLQLHSCSLEVLEKGEAIEAVLEAKRAGKTRYVGYSGDNADGIGAGYNQRAGGGLGGDIHSIFPDSGSCDRGATGRTVWMDFQCLFPLTMRVGFPACFILDA